MFSGITCRVERQARLIASMMERMGLDPVHVAERDRAFAAAARRCVWCAAADDCERWLSEPAETTAAPAFCPNGALFEDVARQTAKADGD
jgi:hypothetical protein